MSESSILLEVEKRRDRWVDLLGEIVSQESGTHDIEEASVLSKLLGQHLRSLDFDVAWCPRENFAPHVIARRPSRNGKTILLVGHFDTVWPRGTIGRRPFRVEDGRAYGPGAFDMKGGIVVMLAGLTALRDSGSRTFADTGITVVLNSDEEVFSPSSGPLIRQEAARAQTACILEPPGPNGGYIIARKGAGRYVCRVHGRASHAGRHPERGISANLELAHKILKLHALSDYARGVSVNVGVMRGGDRANVISPDAYAEIDLRAFTAEDLEATAEAIRAIVATSTVEGATAEMSGDLLFRPVPRTPAGERLYALMRDVARTVGFEASEFISGGGSDASNTASTTPTLDGMGPCGDGAHMEVEYVIVDSLIQRAQAFALFLHRWPDRLHEIVG